MSKFNISFCKIFFCFFFSWSVKKYNKWKTTFFVYFKHILLFNNKQLDATQVSQIRSVFSNTSINTKFIYISTTLCFLYYCFVFISVVFYQLNNYVSENVERDLFLLHYSRIHCMSFFVSTWRVRISLTCVSPPYLYAWPMSEHEFLTLYVMVFFCSVIWDDRWLFILLLILMDLFISTVLTILLYYCTF